MRKYILFIICFLLIQPELSAQITGNELDILFPRSHNPIFAEPGDTVTVELRDTSEIILSGWTAILKNDLTSSQVFTGIRIRN